MSTDRARAALSVGGFLCSFLFLGLALRKVELSEVTRALRAVNPRMLVLSLATIGVFTVLVAARWRYLLSEPRPVPFGPVYAAMMVGYFSNNVLPARAGDILRAHTLGRRQNLSRTFTLATIVVERLLDVATMLLFLLILIWDFPVPAWASRLALAGSVLLAVSLLGVGIVWRSGENLMISRKALWLRRFSGPLRDRLGPFRGGLKSLKPGRRLAVLGVLSTLIWLASTLSMYLTLDSLGIHVPIHALFFTLAVLNLGLIMPSSPGFLGTYQFLCMSALGFFRVPENAAFTFSIVQHALWYVPVTLLGFLFFWKENASHSRSRRALGERELRDDPAAEARGGDSGILSHKDRVMARTRQQGETG